MIRHILKLIKKRFSNNLWILSEMLVVFMILWFMTDYFLMQGIQANRPVGFKVENVYRVTVALRPANSISYIAYEEGSTEPRENYRRIVDLIRQRQDVEAVCIASFSLPYDGSNMVSSARRDSIRVDIRDFNVSPDYFRVFGIRPASGGNPDELATRLRDRGVIAAGLAQTLFGRTDVVGEEYFESDDTITTRINAVTEYIRGNEFDRRNANASFSFLDLNTYEDGEATEMDYKDLQLCFRTRPGVEGGSAYANRFMEEMKKQLEVGNYWVSDVKSYEEIRAGYLDRTMEMTGRKLFSVLGTFFLVNVFLAVIGTFWFHVIRRRSELGLRMAVGSGRQGIRRLMLGEGLLLLTIAAVPAVLIFIQLAYLDVFSTQVMKMTFLRFAGVTFLTWILLALVILLATWYPADKASQMAPADALHYE